MSQTGPGSETTDRMIRAAGAAFGAFVLSLLAGGGLLAGAESLIESGWTRPGHAAAWVGLVWWALLGLVAIGFQHLFDFAAPDTRWYVAAKGLVGGIVSVFLACSAFAGFLTEWAGDSAEYQRAAFIHIVEGGAPAFLWFMVIGFNNSRGAPRLASLMGRWGVVAAAFNLAVWLTGWRAGVDLPAELGALMAGVGAMAGYTVSMDEDSRSDDTPEHLRETARSMPQVGWMAHLAAPLMALGPVVSSLVR